jgi:methylated-DNA-protein-cysteine methyltransferase-like protein
VFHSPVACSFQFRTVLPLLFDSPATPKFRSLLFSLCRQVHALYPTRFWQNVLAAHAAHSYDVSRVFYLIANAGVRMSWDPVYKLVKLIPRGRVLTYGTVAKALHLPGGARTAGRAMAGCPPGKGIPWHRVVGANGKLLIREPYASLQRKLLETEGVDMTERHVNMKVHQWSMHRRKKAARRGVTKKRR